MRREAKLMPIVLLVVGCSRPDRSDGPANASSHDFSMTTLADSIEATRRRVLGSLAALRLYEIETGQPPSGLENVYAASANPGLDSSAIHDTWGTRLRFELSADSISLQAAGADRIFDTADDFRRSIARER